MIDTLELIRWARTLPPGSSVGVDEEGLALGAVDASGHVLAAYLEIGGMALDEEE